MLHVAPLGLCLFVDRRVLYTYRPSGAKCADAFYTHVAPLGLEGRGMPPVYTHVAPLGLNAPMRSIHMSPLWG